MSEAQFSVLLPTAYLPSIQWFVYVVKAGRVFIEQHETYPKQTYRNRCEIAAANGKLSLTIPVVKVFGNHTKTHEISIADYEKWQLLHWRALTAAYANSPYFLYYQDELKPFYTGTNNNLLKFNLELTAKLMNLLGIKKSFELTSTFELKPANVLDLRNEITPKKPFSLFPLPAYWQVFQERNGFYPGLSVVDLLFNLGPESIDVLEGCNPFNP